MKKEETNAVGWFEIAVTDMDRAEAFYTGLTGLTLARQEEKEGGMLMSWFPMPAYDETPQYGASGALVQSEYYAPSMDGTIVYFAVASVDATLETVEELGGKILFPNTDIGEHGFFAWVGDTEGNRIGIHSMEK